MNDLLGIAPITIKALSWKEPFASLMLHGKIETRTWKTKYRGLVLICASKKAYSEMDLIGLCGEVGSQLILGMINSTVIREQPGKAIAVGTLVDCRPMRVEDVAKCFVKYNPKLYCHVYENVIPIEPFDWKGSQGWKDVPQLIVESLLLKYKF